jgi:tetratricopeptide (TPR) repeat protein
MVKKWARRNRSIVRTVLGSAFLVLASLACLLVWRLHEGEKLAEERQQMAEDQAARIQQDLDRLSEANTSIQSGRFHMDCGQWARAHEAFTHAIELRPDNSFVWYERAELYVRMGLWDRAAADCAEAFRIQQPPVTRHRWMHVVLRAYVGDREGYRQACASLRELIDETYLGRENELARACTVLPDPDVDLRWTKRMAERAVKNDAQAPWNLYVLGMAHYRAGEYAAAAERFKESLRADPTFLDGCLNHCGLAMACHKLGRQNEAAAALAAATKVIDRWTWTMVTSGNFRPAILAQEWLEILLLHREATVLLEGTPPPDDAHLLVVRGRALKALNCDDEANACYARALQLRPDDSRLRLALSQPRRDGEERGPRAVGIVKVPEQPSRPTGEDPDSVNALTAKQAFGEAILLLLLKDDLAGYGRVCKNLLSRFNDPQNPDDLYMLTRILTLAPNDFFEPVKAVKWAKMAVVAHPQRPWYLHTLAVAHYRAGQFAEALEQCHESIKVDGGWGGDVLNELLLAMAYKRLAHGDEARQWLEKAKQTFDKRRKEKPHESPADMPVPSWGDRLEVDLLLREAEALIGTKNGR